ncbi:OmpA family protein [Flavobacterium sp. LMO8]|uniref:OmpA family protein n=1 Tax=Flavobacterium sp. LMO8 TaxID=2654244 RepID=UPI001291BAA0|nr:OmpA family protein [Flavobacterium sp. LMO8]MQP25793.1 OmpA family protein [Flavobacterium sp. LMO8]
MKKITILALLAVAVGNVAFAQKDHYTISGGLLGGGNLSQFQSSTDNLTFSHDFKHRFGWDAGAWVNFPIGRVFSIEPQVVYSNRGFHSYVTDGSQPEQTHSYISVPLLLKANIGSYFALFGGAEFNTLVKIKDDNNNFDNIGEDMKKHSTAVTAGFELAPHSRVEIYARVSYGLVDMYIADNSNPFNNETLRNESFHFGVKFKLFGHKKAEPMHESHVASTTAPAVVAAPVVVEPVKPIAIDTDGDGILDKDDYCPTIAGFSSNFGCPEIILHYTNDSDVLNDMDKADLDRVHAFLVNHPDVSIVVEGHASNPGTPEHNMTLSKERADKSVAYLVSRGISASRMTVKAYGETVQVADNATPSGRAKNRRVVIKIAK